MNNTGKQSKYPQVISNFLFTICIKTPLMRSLGSDVADRCMFQDLVEWIVGLKLSIIPQSKDFCISALHPSSGKVSFEVSTEGLYLYIMFLVENLILIS